MATIRDVKIAVNGVLQVVGGLVRSMNGLLDASLGQRQAMKLASIAFGEAAGKMGNFACSMQSVTNFKEALHLMEELARLRQTETEKIEAEYQRRLALINEFTQDGSEAERKAMENFDAWKTQQDNEIATKEKDAVQARYKAEIDYFSNLENLGVDSHAALKASMEKCYAWV